MRKFYNYLFSVCFIMISLGLQSQYFPIETRILLQPPYPLNLDAYEEYLEQGILEINNTSSSTLEVFFEVELQEESGILSLVSNGALSTPYTAQPGISILSPNEIQEVFAGITFDNFTIGGLTQEQQNAFLLNRQIPEGSYRLCIRAYDEIQQPLSDPTADGCHEFELLFPERPIIDIPFDEDIVDTLGFLNITWSHFLSDPMIAARTEYIVKIINITAQSITNIQNDMANPGISPEYEQEVGTARTIFIQDIVDLDLIPGHFYGVRVTAFDPQGETAYGFSGHSEVITFQYGETAEDDELGGELIAAPEILSPESNGFVNPDSLNIQLSWKHIVDNEDLYPFLSYRFKLIDMDTQQITSIDLQDFEDDNYDYLYDSPITINDTIIRSTITEKLTINHQYALVLQVESSDDRFEFENNGYSELVIFIMGEEEEEEDAEEGCGGDCLETLPTDTKEVAVKQNETYFMGKHMLTIDQVANDKVNGGYEGKGFVTINFLRSVKINVTFNGLKANKGKRIFEGNASAVFDQGITPADGIVGLAASSTLDIDPKAAQNLSNALRSSGQLVSALAGKKTSLPLGFDRDVNGDKMIIGITEMDFSPTKAVLTALFSMENPDWGEYVPALAAKDICFTKSGFGSVVKLMLAKDYSIPLSNEQLILKASESGKATEKGTYCIIDCNGFKEGQITAEIGLPRDVLVPENPDGSIQVDGFAKLTLSGSFNKANDFMLSASMSPCQIPGLEGFSFEMGNGYYDFSDRLNPEGIAFPKGYNRVATDKLWKGVWFSNVTIKAPQDWGFADNESRTSASIRNFIKDDVGISIVGTVDNLVSIETGSIEGFAASIDQLKLDIIRGEFKKVSMTGRLGLPILPEDKYLDYEGLVDRAEKPANSGNNNLATTPEPLSMSFTVKPDEEGYDIDWLKAHIDFEETSQFSLVKNSKEQGFSALLSGVITVQSGSIDAANANRDTGAPEIEMPGLKFEGMEISRITTVVNAASGNPAGNNTKPTNNKKASPFKFVSPTFSFQGTSFANLSGNNNPEGTTVTPTNVLQTNAEDDDEATAKPAKMNGFTMSIDNVGFTFGPNGGSAESVNVENGTQVNLSVSPTVMLVGGQNKNAKSGTAKKDKGFAISASGSFTIEAMVKQAGNQMSFEYKDISLDSFAIEGEIGPIKIEGKLGFYQNDDKFGSGALASLGVELPLMDIGMQARFGTMMNTQGEKDYSYWYFFANASKEMKPGNIPLVKAGAYFSLYGFKGGAYYHMNDANPNAFTAEDRYVPNKNVSLGLSAGIRFSVTEPNVLWADAEFGIQFKDDATLDKITIKGEAYMLQAEPKPMPGNEIDGIKVLLTAQLNVKEIDNETSLTFDADCDIYANIGDGLLVGNMNPSKPNLIVESTMHISDSKFFILAGSPSKPGSVRVGIPDLATITAQAYFMAGKDVEFEEATLDPFIRNLLNSYDPSSGFEGKTVSGEVSTRKADGFAVGLKVDYKLDIKASILYANFRAMFGFDLSMTNADAGKVCLNNGNKPLGMGGYYASGQVYAGLSGDMGLDVDIFFYTGKVSLAKLQAVLLLEGGLPNPIWARGTARMTYSVLGGLIEGSTGFEVQVGEECDKQDVDPFKGANLIADIDPGNQQTNVSVFAKPQVSLNAKMGEYSVPFTQANGVQITRKFRMKIHSYDLRLEGGNVIPTRRNQESSTKIVLEPYNMLSPQKWHTVKIIIKADENINGNWTPYKKNGSEWSVTGSIRFKTGDPPNHVVWENVKMTYPFRHEGGYLQGENKKKEGFLEFGVHTDYLFKPELESNRQWHSKIVMKFYKLANYSSLSEVATSEVKLASGRFFVFKMPNDLPKGIELRCKVMRVYYQNPNYDITGREQAAIVGTSKDYKINIQGKTYENYSDTRPKDRELFAFNFTTSKYNTFYEKANSPNNRMIINTDYANVGYGTSGRRLSYILGGDEKFTYEEIGRRRILESNTTNNGMISFQEHYDTPFYRKIFDYFDYARYTLRLINDKQVKYHPLIVNVVNVYSNNTVQAIDNYKPINYYNRLEGFQNVNGLFDQEYVSYNNYNLRSRVVYFADVEAKRIDAFSRTLVKVLTPSYAKRLKDERPIHMKNYTQIKHDPPRGNYTIKMEYFTPYISAGKKYEASSGIKFINFKY